jgi:hypothetical protein
MGLPLIFKQSSSIVLFLQRDGELRFAGVGGIVEGFAGAVAFGGMEDKTVLEAVGEAGETSLAIDVGAEFQVEFSGVHESVGDVDFDLGGVDRRSCRVGHSEIGGAGADASVEDRDGLGIWLRGRIGLGRIGLPQGPGAEREGKAHSKGALGEKFEVHKNKNMPAVNPGGEAVRALYGWR